MQAMLANITQIASVIDFTPSDKVLNPLPMYHSYSFTAGMMLCLLTGTKLFLYVSPLRYRAIPEIAYRRNCTYLFGTSTFLSYYAKNADALDFYSMRRVISGGEKLGADVARVWEEKFGLRIYQGYGATECAPVIALSTPQCFKAGTVGRLLPGLESSRRAGGRHRARRAAASARRAGHARLLSATTIPASSTRRARSTAMAGTTPAMSWRADAGRHPHRGRTRQALCQNRRRDGVARRDRGGRARRFSGASAMRRSCGPSRPAARRPCCSRPMQT